MLRIWETILVLLLVQFTFAYKTFKNVLVADDDNYEDLIHEKGKYTLVNFYSKSCTHCQKLGPKFEPLAELFNNTRIQIAQLEGLENKRVRKLENIMGFPTIRLYAFDGTHLGSYVGDRSTEDMANFITAHTGVVPKWPDLKVQHISNIKELDGLIKKDKNVLVSFVAPWLEDWNGRYSFIERLASKTTDVKFVKVDATSEESAELSSLYKVDNYPTLFYFQGYSYKNFRKLETEKDINENIIKQLLNKEIGEEYSSLKELENEKAETEEEQEQEHKLKPGFNTGHQRRVSPEEEEESYKKLREL